MSAGPPVICVHGALRSRVGMLPTAAYLRRLGLDARTFGYPTRLGLRHHAECLDAFVEAWLGSDRPQVLGFVTHSMGALVVRAWLGHYAHRLGPRQRLVMLSPPNQGSQLARAQQQNPLFHWLYGAAAKELADLRGVVGPDLPGSTQALVLAGGTGAAGYNRMIQGDDDGVVAVSEMGMPGVEPTLVGGVHGLLQWTPALLRRAAAFIQTGQDDSPGTPDETST